MILVDEILGAVQTTMELAKKHQDKETAEKLVEIYSSILELKKENEELRNKLAEYEHAPEMGSDLVLDETGLYYKKSDIEAGRNLRYCASCYNNTGKLYPITQGSMRRDFFCTNCKMRYNSWKALER